MADIQTDSDADGQSSLGVGQVPQISRALHDIKPNWAEDGYGIRGPQRPEVIPPPARPQPMHFGIENTRNSNSGGSCSPSAPPSSGTYVWGTVSGNCQWIDTEDCGDIDGGGA